MASHTKQIFCCISADAACLPLVQPVHAELGQQRGVAKLLHQQYSKARDAAALMKHEHDQEAARLRQEVRPAEFHTALAFKRSSAPTGSGSQPRPPNAAVA
jgi:hypothetical protein